MIVLRWLLSAITLFLVSLAIPGIHVASVWSALIAALVLGILNVLIKPILKLLTLPITILTLGLFSFVINGLMLWLTSTIVQGFAVASFSDAVLGAILLWLLNWSVSVYLKR